jgi:acyl carrier protein
MSSDSISGQSVCWTRPVSPAQIRALIASLDTVIDVKRLKDTTPFFDAGADSLDFFNIIAEIQIASGLVIPNNDIEQVGNIESLVSYLNAKMP